MNRHFRMFICFGFLVSYGNAQVKFPETPAIENFSIPAIQTNPMQSVIPSPNHFETIDFQRQQIQNEQTRLEAERDIQIWLEQERLKYQIKKLTTLPSFSHLAGTNAYYDAFSQLNSFDTENYSISDVVFLIENAFYENSKDFQKLKDKISQTAGLLKNKMNELGYDQESNTAKNMMLFQYFTENMKLGNEIHKPFQYDFEDFYGTKDYSKMFVSKLMDTGTGQCHSMPLLYLMLAEQIGADAALSFSPNHSYIRFVDKNGHTQNIELTNGMFTTNSFILESGFVKSEALQNKIYMQNLSRKELLSQMYVDLAGGYIHKYGYDKFVKEVMGKALQLYPNNVNALMHKANYHYNKFEYTAKQLEIDPYDSESLQEITNYPFAVDLLMQANLQSKKLREIGYEQMSPEDYIKWITSVNSEKNKKDNQTIQQTLKTTTKKPAQKKTDKIKHDPKKKEEVRQKIFH